MFSFPRNWKLGQIFQFGTDPGLPQELRRLQHHPVQYRCFQIVCNKCLWLCCPPICLRAAFPFFESTRLGLLSHPVMSWLTMSPARLSEESAEIAASFSTAHSNFEGCKAFHKPCQTGTYVLKSWHCFAKWVQGLSDHGSLCNIVGEEGWSSGYSQNSFVCQLCRM